MLLLFYLPVLFFYCCSSSWCFCSLHSQAKPISNRRADFLILIHSADISLQWPQSRPGTLPPSLKSLLFIKKKNLVQLLPTSDYWQRDFKLKAAKYDHENLLFGVPYIRVLMKIWFLHYFSTPPSPWISARKLRRFTPTALVTLQPVTYSWKSNLLFTRVQDNFFAPSVNPSLETTNKEPPIRVLYTADWMIM